MKIWFRALFALGLLGILTLVLRDDVYARIGFVVALVCFILGIVTFLPRMFFKSRRPSKSGV